MRCEVQGSNQESPPCVRDITEKIEIEDEPTLPFPSPQPSPLGRGGTNRRGTDELGASEFPTTAKAVPSPRGEGQGEGKETGLRLGAFELHSLPSVSQPTQARSEAAEHADFSQIRYAQCWEDADVLLEGLAPQPGHVCFSIASAGDNTLALLTRNPERVIAVDLNPAQLACLELRVAAYRALDHNGLLELIGSRPSERRTELYRCCRKLLSSATRNFWDGRTTLISRGIGSIGKFERYFAIFRRAVLPLVHSRRTVDQLLRGGTLAQRESFYRRTWDSWRWRCLFHLFFSRFMMGRCGRDPSFFNYVEGAVAPRILQRARQGLIATNPAENPYLHWILKGRHGTALPCALRAENFDKIRANLDRLEWHCRSVEEFLDELENSSIDSFNLSDIFEYISPESYRECLGRLSDKGRPGARLAYWNTLANRSRPESLARRLRPLHELSEPLHAHDKAFFYCRFVIEEVI